MYTIPRLSPWRRNPRGRRPSRPWRWRPQARSTKSMGAGTVPTGPGHRAPASKQGPRVDAALQARGRARSALALRPGARRPSASSARKAPRVAAQRLQRGESAARAGVAFHPSRSSSATDASASSTRRRHTPSRPSCANRIPSAITRRRISTARRRSAAAGKPPPSNTGSAGASARDSTNSEADIPAERARACTRPHALSVAITERGRFLPSSPAKPPLLPGKHKRATWNFTQATGATHQCPIHVGAAPHGSLGQGLCPAAPLPVHTAKSPILAFKATCRQTTQRRTARTGAVNLRYPLRFDAPIPCRAHGHDAGASPHYLGAPHPWRTHVHTHPRAVRRIRPWRPRLPHGRSKNPQFASERRNRRQRNHAARACIAPENPYDAATCEEGSASTPSAIYRRKSVWIWHTSTMCSASAAATAARSSGDNASRRSRPRISAPSEGCSGRGVGMATTTSPPPACAAEWPGVGTS